MAQGPYRESDRPGTEESRYRFDIETRVALLERDHSTISEDVREIKSGQKEIGAALHRIEVGEGAPKRGDKIALAAVLAALLIGVGTAVVNVALNGTVAYPTALVEEVQDALEE